MLKTLVPGLTVRSPGDRDPNQYIKNHPLLLSCVHLSKFRGSFATCKLYLIKLNIPKYIYMHALRFLKLLTPTMENILTTKLDSEIKLTVKTSIHSFSKHLRSSARHCFCLGKTEVHWDPVLWQGFCFMGETSIHQWGCKMESVIWVCL